LPGLSFSFLFIGFFVDLSQGLFPSGLSLEAGARLRLGSASPRTKGVSEEDTFLARGLSDEYGFLADLSQGFLPSGLSLDEEVRLRFGSESLRTYGLSEDEESFRDRGLSDEYGFFFARGALSLSSRGPRLRSGTPSSCLT
jgi:hypothetical protein